MGSGARLLSNAGFSGEVPRNLGGYIAIGYIVSGRFHRIGAGLFGCRFLWHISGIVVFGDGFIRTFFYGRFIGKIFHRIGNNLRRISYNAGSITFHVLIGFGRCLEFFAGL